MSKAVLWKINVESVIKTDWMKVVSRKLIEMLFQLSRQEVGDGDGNLGVSVGGEAAVRCL